MANNRYKLENILISSSAHLRSLKLKAYFKAIKDLHFDGLSNQYFNQSMTRMQGNRYLMHAYNDDKHEDEAYFLNIDTMTAERLAMNNGDTSSCFVEGQYILVVRYGGSIVILRDLQEIGQIEFVIKGNCCKNYHRIRGRYAQQAGHSVYVVDRHSSLYRVEWQDIKDGKYVKTLVKEDVNNFYVDGRLGLASLNTEDDLSLPSGTEVDLYAKVDSKATWTMVTCIAKCWIACGDRDLKTDGHAIMASINNKGDIISTLKLKLTSNGHLNAEGLIEFAGIYSLHNAYTRGRRGIMLAIERDGCCHLISVNYGIMSKLQSIASIVNVDVNKDERNRIVMSVTSTGTKGEFIAGGKGWTRLISLKLK